jgi:hypothetical protein
MVQRSKKEKVKIALRVRHLDSKNWYSVRLWNRPRKNLKRIGFREKKKLIWLELNSRSTNHRVRCLVGLAIIAMATRQYRNRWLCMPIVQVYDDWRLHQWPLSWPIWSSNQCGLAKEPKRLSGMWEKQRGDKETEHECE